MLVHSLFTYFVWHSRHHHELISHCVDIINVKLRDPSVQTGVEQIHKVDQLEFKTFYELNFRRFTVKPNKPNQVR